MVNSDSFIPSIGLSESSFAIERMGFAVNMAAPAPTAPTFFKKPLLLFSINYFLAKI